MLKRNLFFLFTVTVFGCASLLLDVFNYNPYQATTPMFANFFISLAISITGVLAFVFYYSKLKFSKSKNINSFFFPSIRQAFLISIAITMILVFKVLKILDWWVSGPMIIAIILSELFFQTVSPTNKINKQKSNSTKE